MTDANLVLGILDSNAFAGGERRLDVDLAREAIATHVGDPLGLGVEDAAAAIFAIQNAQTADLLRSVVVGQGFDPRDFVLYAFGGGGPAHCFAYGGDLGIEEIYVPLGDTNAFSAYGLTTSDVILSAEMSDPSSFPVDASRVERGFTDLEDNLRRRLLDQGLTFAEVEMRRELDLRYSAQMFEVAVPVPNGPLDDTAMDTVIVDFESLYAQRFGAGTGHAGAGFQVMNHRVFGIGKVGFKPRLPASEEPVPADASQAVRSTRPVFIDAQLGWEDTTIYDYTQLRHGHELFGPAVIEAISTTVVVPRGAAARVDKLRNVVLTLNDRSN